MKLSDTSEWRRVTWITRKELEMKWGVQLNQNGSIDIFPNHSNVHFFKFNNVSLQHMVFKQHNDTLLI